MAPFAVSWNTTTATNGAHTLTAIARDAAGNTTTSAPVSVTVSNTTGGGTVSTQNAAWINLVNVTATGNSLKKTSGCDGCDDAGATSQQQIASGDGYAEFTATETTGLRVAGLTHAFTVTNSGAIDFGIRLQSGIAEVRENGIYRTDTTFAAGDVFRVAVTAGVVRYSKNGAVFYTSTVVPTYPLFLAAALANLNATISNAVITAAAPDTTPPSVSVTAPTAGATVTGTLSVAATATDTVGVVGVQFRLDGGNLGVEVTAAPYAVAWNTATVVDGTHALTAVARDAAGNSTTSAAVTVTVNNDATPPTISAVTASAISASGATITWTTNELSDSQVEYGLTTAYGNSTALETSAVTTHSQGLSGTAAGTVYHYRVKSRDAAGNLAVSGDFTFATLATSDPSVVMVGSWTLDERSGTTAGDSSGSGNTGSLINGPTWTVGNLGGALAFDGTSQYVNVPDTPALNAYPLTVAVWIKTSTASGVRGVANKYVAGSYNGYNVFLSNGNLCAWYLRDTGNYVYDGSGCPFNVPGYNDNQWHHVAYVVDAAGGRLYVDGLEKGSLGWTGTAGAPTTTQPVQLGHYPGAFGGAEYFAGSLDDVRIYNGTLSATEILALYNLAGPSNSPELPRVVLDTTYTAPTGGTLRTVNAGGDLQAALNVAQPGDVITLEAGATFTGNYTLPNKIGTGWIIIRTSASDASLPPPGTRITPAYATVLPKVVSPNSAAAIATVAGAHHYRLIGLEVTIGAGVTSNTGVGGLVQLGDSTQTTLDQVPHDIILDRVYVHGSPTVPLRRCIALNSAATAVVDSYISDAHHQTFDAQAIAGWNGPGPFKIVNNYLEGSGENLMFGGADPAITNLVLSDIEIRGNHFFKPLTWKSDDRSYAGINWSVKNLFELKNAQRVLADGNLFENNWVAAQNGFAILFTPRNQDGAAPWSVVQDVTFTHNIVRHSASAIVTHGTDTIHTITQQTTRILVKDNVFDDIGTAQWGRWTYPGTGFLFYTGAANVTIDHNTLFNTGPAVYGDISANSGFVYRNNISPYNIGTADYELCCSGVIDNIDGIGGRDTTGNANLTLSTYFPGAVFARNVLAGGASSSNWPVDNFFPATLDAVGFVNPTGGDYHLSTTSLYKNAGTDGKDLGADIDALDAATACAFDGACTSTPPPPSDITPPTASMTAPTAGSTVAGTVTVTADASDNVGVAGVQFKLDGANLGAEVTSAPYAISWNTTTAPIGAHTLTALARDAAGNVATSAGVDVTVANDVTASVISGLTVSSITSSGATILWTTNEPSDTQVEYGVTTTYGGVTSLKTSLVTSHSQALSGLAPRTWYHYRVKSRDAAGNLAVSGDFTFKTKR